MLARSAREWEWSWRHSQSMKLPLIGLAALASTCFAAPAQACFDGCTAGADRVSITRYTDGDWSLREAKMMARWVRSFQRLVPADQTFFMQGISHFEVCPTSKRSECHWGSAVLDPARPRSADGWMRYVFDETATFVGATPAEKARARAASSLVYTVQLASFRSQKRADELVERLNWDHQSGELAWTDPSFYGPGFYSAGGYPAVHDAVHRHAVERNGTTYHRVITGVFLDAETARAQVDRLAKAGYHASIDVSP